VIGVLYADETVLVWSTSLGQLIKIINDNQMNYVVDQLIEFLGGKEDELRDIAGLGTCSSRFHSCIYADELEQHSRLSPPSSLSKARPLARLSKS
jgi:hypothetical protein